MMMITMMVMMTMMMMMMMMNDDHGYGTYGVAVAGNLMGSTHGGAGSEHPCPVKV